MIEFRSLKNLPRIVIEIQLLQNIISRVNIGKNIFLDHINKLVFSGFKLSRVV